MEGTVIRQYRGHYYVATGDSVVDCAISSRLRKQLTYPEADPGSRRRRVQNVRAVRVVDPVAIGDRVEFEESADNTGLIREVKPRRNKISRRASGSGRKEQILAANIDQVIPMLSAAEPEPDWPLLDRMLALAEWQEIPAVICFNKVDLTSEIEAREAVALYERIGYQIVFTSAVTDLGKEPFQNLLQGQTSLLMGQSGVGKSSLLNWLQPGLQLRIGEVSTATGEGRHTTTHTELISLNGGGLVGDIPGVKELRFWGIEKEDLPDLYVEFRPYLGQCRFRDCTHINEPNCALKEAVSEGDIPGERYESYLRIRREKNR